MKRFALFAALALALAACGEAEPDSETINPGSVLSVDAATATPNAVKDGDTLLLQVAVVAENTVAHVRVDLTSIGGAAAADMLDDGANGDVAAGDGTWSLQYTIPAGLTPGDKKLVFRIRDEDDFSYTGVLNVTISSAAPEFNVPGSTVANADGVSGSVFGPTETMQFRIAVSDPDGNDDQMTVTADLSGAFGGSATEALTYNATSGLFELDYVGPRSMTPTGVAGQVVITATDTQSLVRTQAFALNAQNWVGLAGSASAIGISTSGGWTLGSACTVDAQGRIYVAYSSRVNLSGSDWMYAVYVKRYDPQTGTWSGLNGSDSGLGLNLNTQGRVISSGYMGEIQYYAEQNQGAGNQEFVYVLFHGDPDPDEGSGQSLWDSFLYRYNITTSMWEALGTGTDASDWITDVSNPTGPDVGGFTKSGERAQEPRIAFDTATDNVYVTYHLDVPEYAVFVRRWVRATGVWEGVPDATPADGISEDALENCQYPQIAIYGGFAYVAWVRGGSAGDIRMRRYDITGGAWSAGIVTIHDATSQPGGGFPALDVDSAGNLYAAYKVTFTGPNDQQVHVRTCPVAGWDTAANWVGAGGNVHVNVPANTVTNVIKVRVAIDSADNVYVAWNQVHPGSTLSNKRGVFATKWDGTAWRELRGSLSGDGLSDYGAEDHWLPDIAIDPQDRPVVCYDTFWGTGSGNDRRMIYVKALR